MVMDGLWIGSIHAAFNQDSMQDRGITHVRNPRPRLGDNISALVWKETSFFVVIAVEKGKRARLCACPPGRE